MSASSAKRSKYNRRLQHSHHHIVTMHNSQPGDVRADPQQHVKPSIAITLTSSPHFSADVSRKAWMTLTATSLPL